MSRIVTLLDAPMWRLVRELYLADKVEEALSEADKLGGLDVNDLYAEAEVRSRGTQLKLNHWLTLEAIEGEIPDALEDVARIVKEESESLSQRFDWDNREATWVALLPQDVEAPWMPGRWGYFVDKVPYDKICIPHHLVTNLVELTKTVQHEFMHGITLNLSQGRACRWLEEALSTYAEGRLDMRAWRAFQSGVAPWRDPRELDSILETDNRRGDVRGAISLGYSQANLVARFLADRFGEATFNPLLRGFEAGSVWENLQDSLLSRSAADAALHRVYGLSEREVFSAAKDWINAGPVPYR